MCLGLRSNSVNEISEVKIHIFKMIANWFVTWLNLLFQWQILFSHLSLTMFDVTITIFWNRIELEHEFFSIIIDVFFQKLFIFITTCTDLADFLTIVLDDSLIFFNIFSISFYLLTMLGKSRPVFVKLTEIISMCRCGFFFVLVKSISLLFVLFVHVLL